MFVNVHPLGGVEDRNQFAKMLQGCRVGKHDTCADPNVIQFLVHKKHILLKADCHLQPIPITWVWQS